MKTMFRICFKTVGCIQGRWQGVVTPVVDLMADNEVEAEQNAIALLQQERKFTQPLSVLRTERLAAFSYVNWDEEEVEHGSIESYLEERKKWGITDASTGGSCPEHVSLDDDDLEF